MKIDHILFQSILKTDVFTHIMDKYILNESLLIKKSVEHLSTYSNKINKKIS